MRSTFLLIALCMGCESVPDFTFQDVDGSATDASAKNDGATASDAAALGDGGSADSGLPPTPGNCPSPGLGVTCCQAQFCSGDCPTQGQDAKTCREDCAANNCGTPSVCCRSQGAFTACVPFGTTCP